MRNTGFPLQPRNQVACIDARSQPGRDLGSRRDSLINASIECDAIDGKDFILILPMLKSSPATRADSQPTKAAGLFGCADQRRARLERHVGRWVSAVSRDARRSSIGGLR
jgi:hypothetical protein